MRIDAPPALHVDGSTITQLADVATIADSETNVEKIRRMRTCWLEGPKLRLHPRPTRAKCHPRRRAGHAWKYTSRRRLAGRRDLISHACTAWSCQFLTPYRKKLTRPNATPALE